jgi:PAS domain S-box-containing protein
MMHFLQLLPKKFSTRLIAITISSGLIPIIIFSCLISVFDNRFLAQTNNAVHLGQEEQSQRSKTIMKKMSEDLVRQKALDVVLQLEIYLQAHPEMTVKELQTDSKFREIAVQPVGKNGYTAVYDVDTAISRFHKDPQIENLDPHSLSEELTEFWTIVKNSLNGRYSHGYYQWKESGGELRNKFMYLAPVNEKTAEGVRLGVSATSYIDEFTRPILAAQDISYSTTRYLMTALAGLLTSFRTTVFFSMGMGMLFVVIFSAWTGTYLSRAVTSLQEATKAVNQGKFDIRVKPVMSGDVGQLIEDFNRMLARLSLTTVKKEQLEASQKKLETANARLHQEIMERKQAEKALRDSEERFRELAELLPETVFEIDAGGRLTFANRSAMEHFKYTRQDINRGLNGFDMFVPEDRQRVMEDVQKIFQGEQIGLVELTALRKDGSTFPVMVNTTAILQENKPVGLRGIAIDISEQKQLQAQLQQAQKMESIGTLAGGIAHDFNNILYSIIGYTELAIDDTETGSQLHENLQELLTAAHRAGNLVNQILTFSRQTDQELKPLKVQQVVKEVLKLIRSSLPATIEIRQNISEACGLVMADATQIHQVAMNLLTNAYHALEDKGGKMDITLKEVELDVNDLEDPAMIPGKYVCLTVADTGSGIDMSILDRIFEPYYSTKEKGKGTGLGLAMVHGIVKSYGGIIKVYSEPGKGTTFHVYVPVIQGPSETVETRVASPVKMGKERILIVDDEEQIVQMTKQSLERLGYHVTAQTHSIKTLETFRAAPDKFDLVITDMTMPNMTGVQLTQKLIEIRPDIPVIICTGFSEKISEQKAKAMGIRGYIMKPVVRSELAEKIREVLG